MKWHVVCAGDWITYNPEPRFIGVQLWHGHADISVDHRMYDYEYLDVYLHLWKWSYNWCWNRNHGISQMRTSNG